MDEDLKSLPNGLGGVYLGVSHYEEVVQICVQLDSESQPHYEPESL